jgi:hypothetical protein
MHYQQTVSHAQLHDYMMQRPLLAMTPVQRASSFYPPKALKPVKAVDMGAKIAQRQLSAQNVIQITSSKQVLRAV